MQKDPPEPRERVRAVEERLRERVEDVTEALGAAWHAQRGAS